MPMSTSRCSPVSDLLMVEFAFCVVLRFFGAFRSTNLPVCYEAGFARGSLPDVLL